MRRKVCTLGFRDRSYIGYAGGLWRSVLGEQVAVFLKKFLPKVWSLYAPQNERMLIVSNPTFMTWGSMLAWGKVFQVSRVLLNPSSLNANPRV